MLVVLTALAAGCGSSGGPPDAGSPIDAGSPPDAGFADAGVPSDAGIVVDGGPVARTDVVPEVGRSDALEVATWNLKEFPLDLGTVEAVADLIASMNLDLIAVQEITNPDAFAQMMARLPQYASVLSTHTFTTGNSEKLGFIWKTEVVNVRDPNLIFTADIDFPRPPLRATVEVKRAGVPIVEFVVIAVHLKAGLTNSDEQRRIDAMGDLERTVRNMVDGPDNDRVLVLGDFNAAISDSRADEVFQPWTSAPDRYRWLSRPLAEGGGVSFLTAGIVLDHLIATNALDGELMMETAFVPPLNNQFNSYRSVVSDHLPVVIRLPILQ